MIRRLRRHTELISNLSSGGRRPYAILAEGKAAGPFETVATTGEPVSRDGLSGRTLVGAFTPNCSACDERLPAFTDLAKTFPGGRRQVIAVVVGPEDAAATYRARLEQVARVVIEPPLTGEIGTALGLESFPAFAVLDESGTVVSSGLEPDRSTGAASPATSGV
nr:hypothetical protein GCM10010200_032870 [Actinomadura rugatobispora]